MIKAYGITLWRVSQNRLFATVQYLFPDVLMKLLYLLPLIYLWKTILRDDGSNGLALSSVLSYTLISAILSDFLVISSPLTNWYYDGVALSLYQRPMPIIGQVIAHTIGQALPMLLFFGLPMALLSPLLGISLMPQSILAFPSFFLSVSLCFAFELIFAGLFIRVINATWFAFTLRSAVMWFFSGALIPFEALPWGIGNILKILPLGSLSGAFLAIFSGLGHAPTILFWQIIWNLVIWPLAWLFFSRSRERMVSFGG